MRIFRAGIAFVLLSMVLFPASAAESLEETARQVIIAFQQRDNAKINSFIDKDTGMYVMYRIGAGDDYKWMKQFDIDTPVPGFHYLLGEVGWHSEHIPAVSEFDHRTKVQYVCEKGWDHAGYFISYDDAMLSFSMANDSLERGNNISDSEIANVRRLEVLSHRIVAVPEQWGDGLIFHLSELHGINKGWYLTLLDLVSEDCSA